MQMKPMDKYEKPRYPQLYTVEKIIHSTNASGKKAATLAMAVATALSLTTCSSTTLAASNSQATGSKATQPNSTGNEATQETVDLTHATDEGVQTYVTTAGIALVEETMETSQTALAGDILSTDDIECEPSVTGKVTAADDTACTTYGPEIAGSIVAPEDTTYASVG